MKDDNASCDALSAAHGLNNIIIDHVSASWSSDEVLSIYHCDHVAIQWCLITEPCTDPKLSVVINPENATTPVVTWSSNNTGVATVSASGHITNGPWIENHQDLSRQYPSKLLSDEYGKYRNLQILPG